MHVLDLRDLNRATLARQHLLERSREPLDAVVRQVGGIQAQATAPPAIGLWSRISGFERAQLVRAACDGTLVRGTTLRGTLHLHATDHYRSLRMTLQPMLDRLMHGMRRRMRAEDVEPALATARRLFAQGPLTVAQLKRALAARFPDSDPQALANVARMGLQLLVVPDAQAPCGWKTNAPFALASDLLDDPLDPNVDHDRVVRGFLTALGPGTVKDVQAWSGLRGLKDTMRRMLESGELITLTTFEGDELHDLPDAPRPSGDEPAGVRFLPMWDNLLLSHADRSRVVDPTYRPYLASRNGMSPPTFLVDGFVHGTWRVEHERSATTLQLSPFSAIPAAAQDSLVREGTSLLAFLEPDAHDVRVRLG